MSVRAAIENKHRLLGESVRGALGDGAMTITIVSVNGKSTGQWVLSDPRYNKREVVARLRVAVECLEAAE